jgi:NAD(P)-dependent dehydrogenase (short-subunit alcohol dehydrogenase family)
METKEFDGKRELVTGGTKGMGLAIVQRLRRTGATVLTTARSVPEEHELPETFIQADLGDLGTPRWRRYSGQQRRPFFVIASRRPDSQSRRLAEHIQHKPVLYGTAGLASVPLWG